MRLIDADALEEVLEKIPAADIKNIDGQAYVLVRLSQVFNVIKNAPTIEPERKKGEWIHGKELSREMIGDCVTAIFYDGWKCSECDCLVEEEREPLYKYCPYCGADMRKEGDTE